MCSCAARLRPAAQHLRGATATVLLAAAVLLGPMFLARTAAAKVVAAKVAPKVILWSEHCPRLPAGLPRSLCLNYTTATSTINRLCAASTWKSSDPASYYCSGINDACSALEARLSRKSNSMVNVCSPLLDDSDCGSNLLDSLDPRCIKGICIDKGGRRVVPPALPKEPIPSVALLGGNARIVTLQPAQAGDIFAGLRRDGASAGVVANSSSQQQQQQTNLIQVDIDTVKLGAAIPRGFLGTSMEWPAMAYYGRNPQAWGRILGVLGPEAVIRIGGASQDKLLEMPSDENWAAMAALHREAGIRFIVGVPLYGSDHSLAAAMIRKAKQTLPASALAGIELGNEPSFWSCTSTGGWDADGVFQPGWNYYSSFFDRVARQLSGCDAAGKGERLLMGPGWDNLNTITVERSEEVLQKASCYMRDFTLHYYPYFSKQAFSIRSLMDEDLMREAARNATLHVKAAAKYRQLLRITEANTISGAGEEGTSDTFAAALWTTDLAFEFVATGVKSLHLHWGHGGLPAADGLPAGGTPVYAGIRTFFFDNGTSAPMVRPPWYGMVLFQAAVSPRAARAAAKMPATIAGSTPGRLATVTAATATKACSAGQIKVWPVVHAAADGRGRSELRVVVLNKSDRDDCVVVLRLSDAWADAALVRVSPDPGAADAGMSSKVVAFSGGATYADVSGMLTGVPAAEQVKAGAYTVGAGKLQRPGTRYSFSLGRVSAALLVAQDRPA